MPLWMLDVRQKKRLKGREKEGGGEKGGKDEKRFFLTSSSRHSNSPLKTPTSVLTNLVGKKREEVGWHALQQ